MIVWTKSPQNAVDWCDYLNKEPSERCKLRTRYVNRVHILNVIVTDGRRFIITNRNNIMNNVKDELYLNLGNFQNIMLTIWLMKCNEANGLRYNFVPATWKRQIDCKHCIIWVVWKARQIECKHCNIWFTEKPGFSKEDLFISSPRKRKYKVVGRIAFCFVFDAVKFNIAFMSAGHKIIFKILC